MEERDNSNSTNLLSARSAETTTYQSRRSTTFYCEPVRQVLDRTLLPSALITDKLISETRINKNIGISLSLAGR